MTIDEFQQGVLRIRPNTIYSLGGGASSAFGATDSGSVVVAQLQRAVIVFARHYKDNTSETDILAARREVLAKIMVALTVNAITQQQADELVDGLSQLMEERK